MRLIEPLEDRKLFAITVSAVDLAGPVIKGTVHSYLNLGNGGVYAGTATETEYGPIRMNGKTIYKDETTTTDSVGKAGPITGTYSLLNNKYGQRVYQSTTVGTGSRTARTVVGSAFDPAQIALPASLTSGKSYQSVGTTTESTTVGTAAPTVKQYAYSVVQSIRAKATKVSTALGDYRAYVVDTVITAIVDGVTRTTSVASYFSVGVGLVKRITVLATSNSTVKTSSQQSIIGFKVGRG